jgi:subtilisin family serine protease
MTALEQCYQVDFSKNLASLRRASCFPGSPQSTSPFTQLTKPQHAKLSSSSSKSGKRRRYQDSDGTLSQARSIGALTGNMRLGSTIGGDDRNDYYNFSLNQTQVFNLSLYGLQANADVQLLDSAGQMVNQSYRQGRLTERINQTLAAGTYYIRVYAQADRTRYILSLATNPPPSVINAAAAVAAAANSTPLPPVANMGGLNWGLDMINAPEVWQHGITGQDVVVAVIDSGVDYFHSDLDSNIWSNSREIPNNGIDDDNNGYIDDVRGWNFVSRNNAIMDDNGHGTHVAGIIAAEQNGAGITGVAYSAKIMPVKVVNKGGYAFQSNIAAGIRYAADNGADVINLSLGSNYYSSEIEQALQYASQRDVVIVMAAGNEAAGMPIYPARLADQAGIAVGAVNSGRQVADFSNRPGAVLSYVNAPGVDIFSTLPFGRYGYNTGTSMATPFVAGVAALVRSANSTLTAAQIEDILVQTVS